MSARSATSCAGEPGQLDPPAAQLRAVPLDQREYLQDAIVDRTGQPVAFGLGGLPADKFGHPAFGAAGREHLGELQPTDRTGRHQQQDRRGRDMVHRRQVARLGDAVP